MTTPSTVTSSNSQVNTDYEKMLKTNPNMTLVQFNKYKNNRSNFYKGSIAVCVTYSVFAFLLLMLALFSERAKEIIGDTIMPFTITFVIGTVIIVTCLVIQITTYKPTFNAEYLYDRDVCPNYWKLEKTPDDELATFDPSIKAMMKYRCKPDNSLYPLNTYYNSTTGLQNYKNGVQDTTNPNIYGHTVFTSNSANSTDPSKYRYGVVLSAGANDNVNNPGKYQLVNGVQNGKTNTNYLNQMYGNSAIYDAKGSLNPIKPATNIGAGSTNTMMCDMVYPNFIASKDYQDFPDSPNLYRCQWASACGIPWTTACPANQSNSSTTFTTGTGTAPSPAPAAGTAPPK